MRTLGLIGKNISYSFSRNYFKEKFVTENLLEIEYINFDVQNLDDIKEILNHPSNIGFNVTIPYKEEIIPYLNELDKHAKEIGAVNTIKKSNGKLIGYNTDWLGFKLALENLNTSLPEKALILGTGGAAKAIIYALKQLNIKYLQVSRKPENNQISYEEITKEILIDYPLIINCTPIGTFPDVSKSPEIPYELLTDGHILYDLIYNPEETQFLKNGKDKKSTISNGFQMLVNQANLAWNIWMDINEKI